MELCDSFKGTGAVGRDNAILFSELSCPTQVRAVETKQGHLSKLSGHSCGNLFSIHELGNYQSWQLIRNLFGKPSRSSDY